MSSLNHSWQSLYQDALVETDLVRKLERIKAAEDAVIERRRELARRRDFCEELYATENALLSLWDEKSRHS